ncbi:MAG: hypothetical protein WC854_05360 [Bacteroidales bacterium]
METETRLNEQEENLEREAKVALQRIKSIDKLIKETINERLLFLRKKFEEIMQDDQIFILENPDDRKFNKERNKLKMTPKRLWFNVHGIDYYIEFTIKAIKNETITNLVGCFIYGTSYYIEKDKVEDKPIVSFFIDEHDIITANNDFENELWTCEEKDIIDLHLRTLDKIWEEALYLINKDKF